MYQGDLTFTEENTTYGWPAHLTVKATFSQNGADITGEFDLMEVMYSGGYVCGTVNTAAESGTFGTFKASFLPDDLGDPFTVDTKITTPDGSRLDGTFIFADGVVGHGSATFTRVQ